MQKRIIRLTVVCVLCVLSVSVVMLCLGCGGPTARAAPVAEPTATVAPRIEAEGDVHQILETVQETLNRIEQTQQSQRTELAGKIQDVESVVQNVEKTMYGLSPEQLQLEQDRLREQSWRFYQLIGVLVGILMIALAAPAVGGTLVFAFYIAGGVIIIASVFFPLVLPLMF